MISLETLKWIDLTHTLSERIPTWDGSCGFQCIDVVTYENFPSDYKFLGQRLEMFAGIGTHMDAPAHCFAGGKTIAEIPLQSLINPCVVIDVSQEANEEYSVGRQTLEQFENQYGEIGRNQFVIFYTGWERFWNEPAKYHNNHRFPCVSKEVAEYLVTKDIAGIGIDTLSPDRGDQGFPVHQILLGTGKYIVENVANATQMPAIGGYSLVLPIKVDRGAEAPVRLIGMC